MGNKDKNQKAKGKIIFFLLPFDFSLFTLGLKMRSLLEKPSLIFEV